MKYSRIICHIFILSTSRLAYRTTPSSILRYIGPHRFVIILIIRSVINRITWYSSTWMIVFWKNNSIVLKWLNFPTYKWSRCIFYSLSTMKVSFHFVCHHYFTKLCWNRMNHSIFCLKFKYVCRFYHSKTYSSLGLNDLPVSVFDYSI